LPRNVSVHVGNIIREQFCAWLKLQIFSVLVDMDSVNAMASYRPVEQACGANARLLNRPICIVCISWNSAVPYSVMASGTPNQT
jgi:hypothetical protein